jgi:hypothetical protein
MNSNCTRRYGVLTAAVLMIAASSNRADEGMWLYSNPPRKLLKEKYGFEPSDAWLEHLQRSSVRFNSGGSGEFVSEDGLVLSNHHVGADALQKFSDKDHNYVHDGFYAKTYAEEKRCLDLELNVLINTEDVTARVNAAVKPDATPEQAFVQRRAVMAQIEKESLDKTSLRSDVVTLYQGGQYHLYRFKKYTDVRLVFAPEQQIAFYGGDPDNFEYPRFDLDICLFRAYENGQPAKIEHHLTWSKSGAGDNELIFVSGHPGRTSRLLTVAELEYVRDIRLPNALQRLKNLEVLLGAYSERSEENARRAREELFSVQNSRKALDGELAGILDPEFLAGKRKDEQNLKEWAKTSGKFPEAVDAWERIAGAQKVIAQNVKRYNVLEGGQGFNSDLFHIARTLLRASEERPKPNPERLREFGEAGRESLEFELFSDKPIYDDLEILTLSDSLTFLTTQLGASDPLVQKVLAGKSPRERAADLVQSTKVKNVTVRRQLYEKGKEAVEAAHDPMIEVAQMVDSEARELRKVIEAQSEIKQQAQAQIGKVRFAKEGTSQYPDATFTLRLAFGVVKGYEEDGKQIPFETSYDGLYGRATEHKDKAPFDLPERWVKRKSKLNLKTPVNFVNTADIIGGNSGSPVVNRAGEFVGIIFDGNIQSLVADFYYTEKQGRAVAVHSQGIIEALRKVYDAGALADELVRGKGLNREVVKP